MCTIEERRNKRVKKTAEVFTPHTLVNQMLDKLPKSTWEEGKTFCDPAAGNGNMLINVLYRKIAIYGHDPLEALKCVYGVDIMRDNIHECRIRLLGIISVFEQVTEEHIKAIFINTIWLNQKKYPKGSLGYDFGFRQKHNHNDIDRWMKWIENGLLEKVSLPVNCGTSDGGIIDMFADENDSADN